MEMFYINRLDFWAYLTEGEINMPYKKTLFGGRPKSEDKEGLDLDEVIPPAEPVSEPPSSEPADKDLAEEVERQIG